MKKIIWTMALFLSLQNLSFSQFTIKGKVFDKETNEKLSGAHIIIKGTYNLTTSDKNGGFIFKKLKKGNYVFRVSYVGYKTIEKTIDVNKNLDISFGLSPEAILEDEVIVSATRASDKEPLTYKNISKKEIKEINLGQDLPYIIESTPSTVVTSDAGAGIGYTGIRIRGTDITRINVTVNGIPINDSESHGVFWVNMPDFASSVDNIQIQRGVGSSTNGAAAFGASINIQTLKLNRKAYAEINSSAGSFNTFKNSLSFGTGLIDGKWTIDGRLSKISSDGYIDRATSDLKSFFVSAGYYGKHSILRFNIFSGKEKTYQAWEGVPKDSLKTNRTYNPYSYENETDNYWQDNYQAIYSNQLNNYLNLNFALHYTKGKGYYEQFKTKRKFKDYRLENVIIGNDTITKTNLIQQKWLDNDFYGLTYSLNYEKNKLTAVIGGAWNKYDGDHYGEVIWAQYASNGKKNHQWYKNKGIKKDFNIFGKLNYQLNAKINLYGDLQYRTIDYSIKGDHDDLRVLTQEHNFNFINPKFGILYQLSSNQKVYFSFGISNREPNRSNYRDADPGHLPKSEKLNDFELGYDFHINNFALEANVFYMDYLNQLVLTGEINNVGAAIMTNVPKSYRAGIEISTGIKILDNFNWDINATFSTNKIEDFTEYIDKFDEDWNPEPQYSKYLGKTDLSFSPDIIAGSIFTYEMFDNLFVNFISKYVSRQYIDNTSDNDRSLDPYFVNNLSFKYSLKTNLFEEIGFHFMLNNIFSEKYETNAWVYRSFVGEQLKIYDGYFPQAEFNFLAGISLKF